MKNIPIRLRAVVASVVLALVSVVLGTASAHAEHTQQFCQQGYGSYQVCTYGGFNHDLKKVSAVGDPSAAVCVAAVHPNGDMHGGYNCGGNYAEHTYPASDQLRGRVKNNVSFYNYITGTEVWRSGTSPAP